jgi:AGCS family alanine or glycine:cation symporter
MGAALTLDVVWNTIDLCMALLTACNLTAIVLLGKYTFRLLDDYCRQRRSGISDPQYHRSTIPELRDVTECWPE